MQMGRGGGPQVMMDNFMGASQPAPEAPVAAMAPEPEPAPAQMVVQPEPAPQPAAQVASDLAPPKGEFVPGKPFVPTVGVTEFVPGQVSTHSCVCVGGWCVWGAVVA